MHLKSGDFKKDSKAAQNLNTSFNFKGKRVNKE